jgi:hypothetical protein
MGNIFYTTAIIFIILWGIGFVVFKIGGFFHLLLVIALMLIIIRLMKRKQIL